MFSLPGSLERVALLHSIKWIFVVSQIPALFAALAYSWSPPLMRGWLAAVNVSALISYHRYAGCPLKLPNYETRYLYNFCFFPIESKPFVRQQQWFPATANTMPEKKQTYSKSRISCNCQDKRQPRWHAEQLWIIRTAGWDSQPDPIPVPVPVSVPVTGMDSAFKLFKLCVSASCQQCLILGVLAT